MSTIWLGMAGRPAVSRRTEACAKYMQQSAEWDDRQEKDGLASESESSVVCEIPPQRLKSLGTSASPQRAFGCLLQSTRRHFTARMLETTRDMLSFVPAGPRKHAAQSMSLLLPSSSNLLSISLPSSTTTQTR